MNISRITLHSQPTKYYRARPQKSSSWARPFLFTIIFMSTIATVFYFRNNDLPPEPEVLPSSIVVNSDIRSPRTLSELTREITTLLSNQQGTYSILFQDFNSNESIRINDEKVYTAASVIKIPILAATYQLASQGKLDLDEKIRISTEDVQDWGTGTIRNESQPIIYTVRELSALLMEKSDNTAAYVLYHNVIGEDTMHDMLDDWGLTHTDIEENETTNADIRALMEKMYHNQIAFTKLTDEMIDFMDDSDFEDRLPALLPSTVHVYHKIGNEVRITHDVGIITFNDTAYYLGVLSMEVPDIEEGKKLIAKISQLTYQYMSRKK